MLYARSMPSRRDLLRSAGFLPFAGLTIPRAQEPKGHYDLDPGVTYLNHGSIGTVPKAVRRALEAYQLTCERNPWHHVWGDAWSAALEEAYEVCAGRLGCPTDDLAITRNTTEGMSLLAQGLDGLEGGRVAFSQLNHAGASECFRYHGARRGYAVQELQLDESRLIAADVDELVDMHVAPLEKDVRALVLPHVDNVYGIRHPVSKIAAAARAKGVRWILVDAAQSVGMLRFRADELGVDAVATSAHKWLQAPKGTGLLYLAPALRKKLSAMVVTWGQRRWEGKAQSFTDYGTRNLPALLSISDAVRFQAQIAGDRDAHDRALFDHAKRRAEAHPKLSWRAPGHYDQGGALYGIGVPTGTARDLARALFETSGIVVRPFQRASGDHLRLSPNLANSIGHIDRFFDAVERRL